MAHFNFASDLKWSRKMRLLSVFYFSFEISIACWLLSRPNLRIVSKLTTDVVTYRYYTEISNQKSKYAYRKIFFYKKALIQTTASVFFQRSADPCSLSRHQCSVLLLNSGASSSDSTTVTVNNSTQLVCNQQHDKLLIIRNVDVMLQYLRNENGQWISRICACQAFCPACIQHV